MTTLRPPLLTLLDQYYGQDFRELHSTTVSRERRQHGAWARIGRRRFGFPFRVRLAASMGFP